MKSRNYLVAISIMVFFLISSILIGYAAESSKTDITQYPNQPINIISTSGAGGTMDTGIRGIQPYLSKYLGVAVIVENRTAGGGLVAMNDIYEAKPDGYTLLTAMSSGPIQIRLSDAVKFDDWANDLTQFGAWITGDSNVLAVSVNSEFSTIQELINSEDVLTVAIAGQIGSTDHATALVMQNTFGVQFDIVPYESGAQAALSAMGGHVDCAIFGASVGVDQTRLKALAHTGYERLVFLPDTPTFLELGYPELVFSACVGLSGPPGIPSEIVKVVEECNFKICKRS